VGAYPEGACVPALVKVTNEKDASSVAFEIVYDYRKNGNATDVVGVEDLRPIELTTGVIGDPATSVDNLNDMVFPGWTLNSVLGFDSSGGGVSAAITGPFGGDSGTTATAETDTLRHYNVALSSIEENATAYVLVCAKTGLDASGFPGSSMSVKTGGGGGGSMPIQGGELLQLPALTLTKTVATGSATPDQWSFHVTPSINGQSDFAIPAGQSSVTIPNVEVDGNYTVTETGGPDGYLFQSGAGTNCAFVDETATASLYAAKPAADATCEFTNAAIPFVATTGTITVIENVVNNDGGTATPADFTLSLNVNSVPQNFPGNAAGTSFVVTAGSYFVADSGLVPGYSVSYSSECMGTLSAGQSVTCTVTHDDNSVVIPPGATTGTLTVIKRVVNNDGGTFGAGDFTLTLTASGTQTDFPGNEGGTQFVIDAGDYAVTEGANDNYAASFTDGCTGTMAAGQSRVCTVTNDDVAPPFEATTGTLTVIKRVINDNGGTAVASDFTLNLTQGDASPVGFAGNASGTTFEVQAGTYSVGEQENALGYAASYSETCSGTMAAGESRVCTITNDDPDNGGGDPPPFTATTGTVTIVKQVINDDGGTKQAADFTLMLSASGTEPISFSGNASGTTYVVQAGYYIVSETGLTDYQISYSENCSGTLVAGQSRTCTVTNDDKGQTEPPTQTPTGTLTVVKHVHNVTQSKRASDFALRVNYGEKPVQLDTAYRTAALVAVLSEGYATSVPGDERGKALVLATGSYTVKEDAVAGYRVTYSEGCAGTLAAGASATCVVDNYDTTNPPVNGGGGGWTPGIYGGAPSFTQVPETTPTPRVLGVEDVADIQPLCTITDVESKYVVQNLDTLLAHLGRAKDQGMEDYYNRVLTPRVAPDDTPAPVLAAIRNFVNYGTLSTVRLGHGERAGVVDSFQAMHGRLPQDVCDWQEVIRMANTKMPNTGKAERESSVLATFKAIYSRLPKTGSALDGIALKIMAYGIRPQVRDIDAERHAAVVFYKLFKKLPTTASEWDANRAIAYSGLAQRLLTVDLGNSPGRILSIESVGTAFAAAQ